MLRSMMVIATLLMPSVPVIAQDAVLVWSGGVGIDERDTAPKEGTRLVFIVEDGSYLSGVHVSVKDAAGHELVNTVSRGPWVVLNLAPGSYRVHASLGEQSQGGTVEVSGKNHEFAYMFKAE